MKKIRNKALLIMITALIIFVIAIVVAFSAAILVIITRILNLQMQLNDAKKDFNLRLNNMAGKLSN